MKYYVQLSGIMGHVEKESEKMFKDNFYGIVRKDSDKNKGVRNPNVRTDGFLVWEFETEKEVDNFINYLKTDFARFSLSIYKNSKNIHYGEMTLIPYLDFNQEWNDEKLFKYFNVDKETQNYIREFLPDHHGIRK